MKVTETTQTSRRETKWVPCCCTWKRRWRVLASTRNGSTNQNDYSAYTNFTKSQTNTCGPTFPNMFSALIAGHDDEASEATPQNYTLI